MGVVSSLIYRKKDVLVLGLSGSGKRTILSKWCNVDVVSSNSNYFVFERQNLVFGMWDSDQGAKPTWKHYYQWISALVFVIDSNYEDGIEETKSELHKLDGEISQDIPFLLLSNKKDLPDSKGIEVVTKQLELSKFKRKYVISSICAITGEGVDEAFEWLKRTI